MGDSVSKGKQSKASKCLLASESYKIPSRMEYFHLQEIAGQHSTRFCGSYILPALSAMMIPEYWWGNIDL